MWIKRLSSLSLLFASCLFAANPFQLEQKHFYKIAVQDVSAKKIAETLTAHHIIGDHTHLIVDPTQHQIILYSTAAVYRHVNHWVQLLNHPYVKFYISTKIVAIDQQALFALGAHLNLSTTKDGGTPYLFSQNISRHLSLTLQALESSGRASVISCPMVMVSNNQTAHIANGEEIPYQNRNAHGITNIEFKKALLGLTVTPHYIDKNAISLKLELHQDKIGARQINGAPTVHTEQMSTVVMLRPKQTLLLGGIHQLQHDAYEEHVPFIGRLPMVGKLFSHQKHNSTGKTLIILVTPFITQSTHAAGSGV